MENSKTIEDIGIIITEGEKYRLPIISLSHEVKGIAKISGTTLEGVELSNYPIFVDGTLPGEEGIIKITKMKKNYAFGTIVKMFPDKKSPMRVNPICQHFETCGGCQLMHMSYEAQLAFKKVIVKDTIKKVSGLDNIIVKNVIGMANPYRYRNKVEVPVGMNKYKTILGFYQKNTHNIIPFEECFIQSVEMTEVIKFIKNLCNEFNIRGYDQEKKRGDLRHVVIRESSIDGKIMVVLVTTKEKIYDIQEFCTKLTKRHPKVVSIMQNINPDNDTVIFGTITKNVWGESSIKDTINGLKYEIDARSFYQVNHEQTEKLYDTIAKVGNFNKNDIIIDAYCGIGSIGFTIANSVSKIYGVEIAKEAIETAKKNAIKNGINNVEFVCAKAEQQIEKWQELGIKANAIILDPPRKGCDLKLLATISEMRIPKIIYVSCDVNSFAANLKFLVSKGYKANYVQPVDLFPQTSHIETVCLLELDG